jgi:hypothetical protein
MPLLALWHGAVMIMHSLLHGLVNFMMESVGHNMGSPMLWCEALAFNAESG